ncbi:MAG: tRNA (adenosine(37)-N6)-dimethylallyltransferase MiaA [Parachlamydiales bacterium]
MSTYKAESFENLIEKHYLLLRKKSFEIKKKVIVIAGPTGVGKTKLSISIAQILNGEIISADSMQVYKGMNIGTAKATIEEQKKVLHHLIDLKNINESFNVSEYYTEAHRACREILLKGHVPIVVGGSGFYLHAFLYGSPLGPSSNPELRKDLEQQLNELGTGSLFERLQILDPDYAKTITAKDKHKIVRALEIISITKKKVSEIPKPDISNIPLYNYRLWFLHYPKEILYERVNQRCEDMIRAGFIDEVEILKNEGIENNYSASQSIGYKQCLKFLKSNQTDADKKIFIDEFKQASRKYVKRQFTWFKKEPNFRWLNLQEIGFDKAMEFILQDYEQSMN